MFFWENLELGDLGVTILVWCNRIFIVITVIGLVWSNLPGGPSATTRP